MAGAQEEEEEDYRPPVICAGSMGVGSFITVGKGEPLSWNSCSHGAGRAMSRTKAKATIKQVCFVRVLRMSGGVVLLMEHGLQTSAPSGQSWCC